MTKEEKIIDTNHHFVEKPGLDETKKNLTEKEVLKKKEHYRELFWHTLSRQILLYFLPLLGLATFFHIQYRQILNEGQLLHLQVLAEYQAKTLSLFLRERLVNLSNVVEHPEFQREETRNSYLKSALKNLKRTSDAFIDLGVVDINGNLSQYEGPVEFPSTISYRNEQWLKELTETEKYAVITDVYLGLRQKPHFTIAVKSLVNNKMVILRSALSPEKITDFLTSLEGAQEVMASVINDKGIFQIVTDEEKLKENMSPYRIPENDERGYIASKPPYAYARLKEVPWALVVEDARLPRTNVFFGMPSRISLITIGCFVIVGIIFIARARQLVRRRLRQEKTEAELSGQLAQASKLASVGELAAGIAHEINNPLAVISEAVGLIKDSLDPELDDEGEEININEHLSIVQEAVYRCRDITHKLLSFVRRTENKVEVHLLHKILDEVVTGMLGNELMIANVELVRDYDNNIEEIVTDKNQITQVIVNIVKNAIDAMDKGGVLTVSTKKYESNIAISFRDTGIGMSPKQLESVFMPFYTTKEPGKGTGLGLSVSFSIVKSLGGNMFVESEIGKGSQFTINLP